MFGTAGGTGGCAGSTGFGISWCSLSEILPCIRVRPRSADITDPFRATELVLEAAICVLAGRCATYRAINSVLLMRRSNRVLTIRLGGLYVALVTLTFGLLTENLVFTLGIFQNQGLGVNVLRPTWASTDHAFAYVCLGAFALVALFIVNPPPFLAPQPIRRGVVSEARRG